MMRKQLVNDIQPGIPTDFSCEDTNLRDLK